MTKKYKILKNVFHTLSIISTFGPLFAFVIMGYVEGETVEKVALSLTAIASIVISVISIMTKVHLRSPIFILLIGLWVALDKLLPCIITLSICIILDEVVFTPLAEHYKSLYVINAEIDKRNK